MSNEEKYYDLLIKYLDEPKENDPFETTRLTLLSITKDKAERNRIINKFNAVPGVNCNENLEPDTDNPY